MLITGGCGFIGSNAATYFLGKGYEVDVLDNFSRPGSEANQEHLLASHKDKPLTIVTLDIVTEPERLAKLVAERRYDVVLHTAAQVAVTTSVIDPMLDFRSNALGTLHVLEAVRTSGKKSVIIYTSTNKVYGGLEDYEVKDMGKRYEFVTIPEGVHEKVLLDFHSPYGCSKGSADQYVHDYARIYGIPTIVFRQSCIYGAHQFGMVDQGWVAYLTMRALFDKPITIYGDGKQVRDVLFMSDLARAYDAAIETAGENGGEIFNMGGGSKNTLSLLEFVEFLGPKLGKKIDYSFSDWRPGDQKVYVSDISKANQKLKWIPNVSFEQGFDEMLAWMQTNKELLSKYI
jgi:CDP-paratose 2-epimerase